MVRKKHLTIVSCLLFCMLFTPSLTVWAKIDLISLNNQHAVQATIYKEADLTLIKERLMLQLSEGINRIQFSWANTKIDPTSLSLHIATIEKPINILEVIYPSATKDMAIWTVAAETACNVPVDITYFISGLSWASAYTLFLSENLSTCTLINQIDITNASGQDYTHTQTRLVIGRIHLLDTISRLSSKKYPYGHPLTVDKQIVREKKSAYDQATQMLNKPFSSSAMTLAAEAVPPEIDKAPLSEYFLYTIKGQETFQNGWTQRLESFRADHIIIDNVFRYDELRYGKKTIRFVTLKNDKKNRMGTTPLPSGKAIVFQKTGSNGQLDYIGMDHIDYIPVGKTAELNLGPSLNMRITPKILKFEKKNLTFTPNGDLIGFDEIQTCQTQFQNFTGQDVQAEYVMHIDSPEFTIDQISHPDTFKKIDHSTIAFKIRIAPHSIEQINFRVTIKRGGKR